MAGEREIQRRAFEAEGLTLSYLDAGQGRPLVALHAHWMEAATFTPLAAALAPDWRVIALDQRGHGFSEHSETYSRDDYLGDIEALFGHLGLTSAVLLGNSLGGANAYQFAARNPDRVAALIIEDIGVEIHADTSFALPWAGVFPTRAALEDKIGARLVPALSPSIRETAVGWQLAFDPHDTDASQSELNGDHWADWVASSCPALIVRGRESRVTNLAQLEKMAARRPNTTLVELDGCHAVHFDNPEGFVDAVRAFLDGLPPEAIAHAASRVNT